MAAAYHDSASRNVRDEDFGRALAGEAIHQATEAFLEELIDFFPDPKARGSLRKVVEQSKKVRSRMLDRAEQVVDRFDADREANKLFRSFGMMPASSASIPDPSPSGYSA